ncbi:MAG: ABC transporter ATP-binding protein, partial [Vicinamibacteria bacterium]
VHGFADFGQSYLSGSVAQRIMRRLRDQLFAKVSGFDLAFFRHRSTGELMSRLTNDVMHVQQSVTEAVATSIREGLAILGLIGVMIFMSPELTLWALLVFPLAAVPILMIGRRIRKASRKKFISMADLNQIMSETFRGIRIVQAFGMEGYEAKKFERENRRLYNQYMTTIRARAAVAPVNQILAVIGLAIAVYVGWVLIQSGGLTREQFISFMFAVLKLYPSIKHIGNVNTMIQEGTAASERIFELLDAESSVRNRPGARPLSPIRRRAVFENVTFGYGEEPVLRKVNLVVGAGATIAIVGSSGSGKTTLVNLVPRFYDVGEGRITIDDVDIRDVTLESLRGQIGIVTQQVILFNDTVRNNIAYGSPARGEEEIIEAAKAANAHAFISSMPKGYETVVGEAGVRLSGGEGQRLAIARALL